MVTSNLEISAKKLMASMRLPFLDIAKRGEFQSGVSGWNRTNDPLLKRQVLYRLSYGHMRDTIE